MTLLLRAVKIYNNPGKKTDYSLIVKKQLIGLASNRNDTFVATNLGQYIFGHGFSSVYLLCSFMQKFSPCLSQKSGRFTDFLFEFLVGPGHKLNGTGSSTGMVI